MRYELKSVGIWSFVKMAFFLNIIAGFVFGLFYAVATVILLTVASNMPFLNLPGMEEEALNPFAFFIIFPLMFSLVGGAMLTLFEVFVLVAYNLFARLLGGLEFKLSPLVEMAPSVTVAPITPPARPQPLAPPPATHSQPPPSPPVVPPIPPPAAPDSDGSDAADKRGPDIT